MPGPAEVFVMLWIFGMFALAALAILAVKRLFERHGKKGEKKDGGNGEIGAASGGCALASPGQDMDLHPRCPPAWNPTGMEPEGTGLLAPRVLMGGYRPGCMRSLKAGPWSRSQTRALHGRGDEAARLREVLSGRPIACDKGQWPRHGTGEEGSRCDGRHDWSRKRSGPWDNVHNHAACCLSGQNGPMQHSPR